MDLGKTQLEKARNRRQAIAHRVLVIKVGRAEITVRRKANIVILYFIEPMPDGFNGKINGPL